MIVRGVRGSIRAGRKIEKELGLVAGTLAGDDTLIAYVAPQDLKGLRMSSGNEQGANKYWIPGGYTSGGVPEAVINVPEGQPFDEIDLGD